MACTRLCGDDSPASKPLSLQLPICRKTEEVGTSGGVEVCSLLLLASVSICVRQQPAPPAQNSQEPSDSSSAGGGAKPGAVPQKVEIARPSCFYTPWPLYTDKGKATKYEGTVVFEGIIMTDGTVTSLRILRWTGLDPSKSTYGLDQSVVTTMKKWKCKPAMRDGKPVVPAHVPFERTFRRDNSGWIVQSSGL